MTFAGFLRDLYATFSGILHLQGGTFVEIASLSQAGVWLGIAIVLLAGFSEAIAQSIVLFANKVKPVRFFFSWAIDAFLFLFGYGFSVVSTWAIGLFPGMPHLEFKQVALILAASYAPLLFAFLGAMPYLGRGILFVQRVWHFLAMVIGISAAGSVTLVQASLCVGLGWVVVVLAQQSFGRPIAALGTRLIDAVAGVPIVTDENAILGRVEVGVQQLAADAPPVPVAGGKPPPLHPNSWKVVLGLLGVAALAFGISLALDPMRAAMFGWQDGLPVPVQWSLDLVWISVIAVVVAALMAPMETLGWWAGWYGEAIDPVVDADAADDAAKSGITRYVLYLDGIAQSSARYTPDIETFLDALVPVLPAGVRLIRGVMGYSVLNKPLEEDPIFSWFWTFVDTLRFGNTDFAAGVLGMIVNLRNVLIVAVSADSRYGLMYNFGIAQVLYRSLIANGYPPLSGIPVTLIGYSGGGQMSCGCAHFLTRALDAPVDVISLGGVISGADPILDLEHLYHLVGTKDNIQRIGPVMFPTRWKIAVLSYWNRARRLGRVTQISLGPVGHQVPGGMLDPDARLPDGRTNLKQTLDLIVGILDDRLVEVDPEFKKKTSNYDRYVAADWNRPEYYPLTQRPSSPHYRPVGDWVGRLILPARDERFQGAWLEVHHAPREHVDLVGTRAKLVWDEERPDVAEMLRAVRRDVAFSPEADYTSAYGGLVHPVRVNRWRLVDPLESLAGSHPIDDVLVKLAGDVLVEGSGSATVLRIARQPVQTSACWYGLVQFTQPAVVEGDAREVTHFNPASGRFDTFREKLRFPAPVVDADGRAPWVGTGIEFSRLNHDGWFVYGAPDANGTFVVRSMAPRALLAVELAERPERERMPYRYLRRHAWRDLTSR
ncbi:MAG: CAAX protease, partial [Candidatus Eremiobacteraeota bacterium]|nr:CAAX protease [Candidatus Eremiobacteraeota bacterium]